MNSQDFWTLFFAAAALVAVVVSEIAMAVV